MFAFLYYFISLCFPRNSGYSSYRYRFIYSHLKRYTSRIFTSNRKHDMFRHLCRLILRDIGWCTRPILVLLRKVISTFWLNIEPSLAFSKIAATYSTVQYLVNFHYIRSPYKILNNWDGAVFSISKQFTAISINAENAATNVWHPLESCMHNNNNNNNYDLHDALKKNKE